MNARLRTLVASEPARRGSGVPIVEKQGLMRSTNAEIASFAAGMNPPDLHWVFACECGAPKCTASVGLELPEYEAITADPYRSVLAEGHVSSPARRARGEAAELRDSARALRGQAELQRDRAQRLSALLGRGVGGEAF